MDGQYWKGDWTMSTNEWLLTSDFWQFLKPWHGRIYEYEIFIASCTDNIYDLENERWLLGDMIDHVGIYGSRVAEGLLAFNVGLVLFVIIVNSWLTKIFTEETNLLLFSTFALHHFKESNFDPSLLYQIIVTNHNLILTALLPRKYSYASLLFIAYRRM